MVNIMINRLFDETYDCIRGENYNMRKSNKTIECCFLNTILSNYNTNEQSFIKRYLSEAICPRTNKFIFFCHQNHGTSGKTDFSSLVNQDGNLL